MRRWHTCHAQAEQKMAAAFDETERTTTMYQSQNNQLQDVLKAVAAELKKEKDTVQINFPRGNKIKRGVIHCVAKSPDVALCKLKAPVNAFKPAAVNSDLYTSSKHEGKQTVLCVGQEGGYHTAGPKALEYEKEQTGRTKAARFELALSNC